MVFRPPSSLMAFQFHSVGVGAAVAPERRVEEGNFVEGLRDVPAGRGTWAIASVEGNKPRPLRHEEVLLPMVASAAGEAIHRGTDWESAVVEVEPWEAAVVEEPCAMGEEVLPPLAVGAKETSLPGAGKVPGTLLPTGWLGHLLQDVFPLVSRIVHVAERPVLGGEELPNGWESHRVGSELFSLILEAPDLEQKAQWSCAQPFVGQYCLDSLVLC